MNFIDIKKLFDLLYQKTNIAFVFWFLVGILFTVVFYKSFDQPILFDRAYLLYMSQVVFRGDSLYAATTFGYTPLSTILIGLFMKVGALFSLDTIESARIAGILLYGLMCGSVFKLFKSIFYNKWAPFIGIILFCGIGYLQILSGVNAEPKLWVLAFSILGLRYFIKNNWLLVGLFFSAAAMCWHASIISLFACVIMLPWNSKKLFSSFSKLSVGVFLATIPVLIYLFINNGWLDFWNQAILRKLVVEGEVLAESPLRWLFIGIYPHFILESLHFIFGLIGFLMVLFFLYKKKLVLFFKSQRIVFFLVIYTLLWSVFNFFEFQGSKDIIPILLPILIFATFFILIIKQKIRTHLTSTVLVVSFLIYNYCDAFIYDMTFTFKEQKELINSIKEKYGTPFVIRFEEFYTVLEMPMLTKFMRYSSYEDHMIQKSENGCEGIENFLRKQKIGYIIKLNKNKVRRGGFTGKVRDLLRLYGKEKVQGGECANNIIKNMTSSEEYDFFNVKLQRIPLGDYSYVDKNYSIFQIKQ